MYTAHQEEAMTSGCPNSEWYEEKGGDKESQQEQKQQKISTKSELDQECAQNDLYKAFVVEREASHFQLTLPGWSSSATQQERKLYKVTGWPLQLLKKSVCTKQRGCALNKVSGYFLGGEHKLHYTEESYAIIRSNLTASFRRCPKWRVVHSFSWCYVYSNNKLDFPLITSTTL